MKKIITVLAGVVFLIPAVGFAAFDHNLSYGASGSDVTSLQSFLTAQGLYAGPITGNFFGLTRSALINFQKKNAIQPAVGFFGPTTRGVANNLLTSNTTKPTGTTGQTSVVQSTQTPPSTSLPSPTASQVSGIMLLCSTAGTLLNGYNTNAIFRSDIDILAQRLQQKLGQQPAATTQQKTNCNFAAPYDPSVTPAGNILASQLASTEQQACTAGTATAWQQEQQQTQQILGNYQLQQLQGSVDANTRAIQAAQQKEQADQLFQQTQKILQQNQQTTPKQVRCFWNVGVWDCNYLTY